MQLSRQEPITAGESCFKNSGLPKTVKAAVNICIKCGQVSRGGGGGIPENWSGFVQHTS